MDSPIGEIVVIYNIQLQPYIHQHVFTREPNYHKHGNKLLTLHPLFLFHWYSNNHHRFNGN